MIRVLLLVILLGAGLRFHELAQDRRFVPDEALFSSFARDAAIKGEWFFPGPLDKPPLSLYANALAQVFIGSSEFAARLPATLASILLIPLLYALARALSEDHRLACIAALFTALSPYLRAYSASALTDGLMLGFMVLALWLSVIQRWGWAGLALGLAFASKQQALVYLPLLLLLGWARGQLSRPRLLHFVLLFSVTLIALWLWDWLRPGTSLFALASVNNNPARLIRSTEILPRLQTWMAYAQVFGPITWPLVIFLLLHVRKVHRPAPTIRSVLIINLTLFNFSLAYALLHWLVAFNLYDRYLLPLLPPVILLMARVIPSNKVLLTIIATTMLISTYHPLENPDDYAGIKDLAAYLNEQPVATVIYDHWLGWELRYYLGPWHDKRVVYYPYPAALMSDALTLNEAGLRYFPVPADQAIGPWLAAFEQAGFQPMLSYQKAGFKVYQLRPPSG